MISLGLDRRQLLKSSAIAAAAALLPRFGGAAEPGTPASTVPGDGIAWDKAPCRFCGTGCGVLIGVKDGRVVAVQGDKAADVNKGLCCMKGYHVGLILYGQDRLTMPRLRVGPGYAPEDYRDIGWDEAVDIIAKRIAQAPGRFAVYGSGQWTIGEGFAANTFVKAGLGHNHIDPNARLCMASAAAGYNATYGVDEPTGCYDDLDHCSVLISWGNNPAEMHPVLFSRAMDRRLRGEQLLFIDLTTRRTRSSELADHVAFFKPNTDLAIANGIAHVLCFTHKMHEKPWVANHFRFRQRVADPVKKDGAHSADYDDAAMHPKNLGGKDLALADYLKALEAYTPEHVEELSGVPASLIRLMADKMADPKENVNSWWCMGPNQHTRGTAMNSLIHSIHHLSGQWGVPGKGAFSLTGQPSACGTAREVGTFSHLLPGHLPLIKPENRAKAEHLWEIPEGRLSPTIGTHTVKLWDEFCKEDGMIDTVWVQATNPGQTLPNQHKLFLGKRGKEAKKFLIVSDVYPTATTALADLILPSAMYVEKNGMYGNGERKGQHWFKMVEPPGQARDDAWQLVAVSRKLFESNAGWTRTDKIDTKVKQPDGTDKVEKIDQKTDIRLQTDAHGNWVFARIFGSQETWRWEQWYATKDGKPGFNPDKALIDAYRPFTLIKHKDIAPYEEYVKAHGLRWPVVQQADGSWKETRWRFVDGFPGGDPYVAKFKPADAPRTDGFPNTWFYHAVEGDGRAFIWFHPYEAPPESPDKDYPMWLCTGRVIEHWHSGSMTMRVPQLRRSMPNAYVELHPEDAAAIGVTSGQQVVVESRRGALTVPAWIDGRGKPPKGTCFVPFFDERLQINQVTLHHHDPFSKQPDFKKCAVRIRKA